MKLLGESVGSSELKALLRESALEELLNLVHVRHEAHFDAVRVGDEVLEFLQISDMPAYIDRALERPDAPKGADALPLWAKIWPASLPLAMLMQRQTPAPGETILEIGAGVGVVGLFAASRGFSVVISDNNPDALLFARINALRNNLGHCVEVRFVDFSSQDHQGHFSRIIGSEVLYQEALYEPLLRFFLSHLRPGSGPEDGHGGGEILMSADVGRRALKFFLAAANHFHIARSLFSFPPRAHGPGDQREGLLTGTSSQGVTLYRMRPR